MSQASKSVLANVRSHWETKGWDEGSLKSFRMEGEDETHAILAVGDVNVPVPSTATPPSALPSFSAEDIAKARQQEKDKLYPAIETMKAELKALKAAAEERAEAEKRALDEAAALAKKAAEEEMSFKELIQAKDLEYQQRFETLAQENARKDALLDQERRYAMLQGYKAECMEKSADDIMPELRDLVTGNSPEEIDASIATMIARTSAILNNVASAQQQQRSQMRGVTPTAPASGPGDTEMNYQTLTESDIKSMSMDEYSKHRSRLLGAAQNRPQGMFG